MGASQRTIPGLENYGNGIYSYAFTLNLEIGNAPEKKNANWINLRYDNNMNQTIY
jgi:hypothetical protein